MCCTTNLRAALKPGLKREPRSRRKRTPGKGKEFQEKGRSPRRRKRAPGAGKELQEQEKHLQEQEARDRKSVV